MCLFLCPFENFSVQRQYKLHISIAQSSIRYTIINSPPNEIMQLKELRSKLTFIYKKNNNRFTTHQSQRQSFYKKEFLGKVVSSFTVKIFSRHAFLALHIIKKNFKKLQLPAITPPYTVIEDACAKRTRNY